MEQYRLQVLASDVQQAVQALGHSSCTLVAHDWGGMVAWVVAGMYGRQVRACCHMCCTGQCLAYLLVAACCGSV